MFDADQTLAGFDAVGSDATQFAHQDRVQVRAVNVAWPGKSVVGSGFRVQRAGEQFAGAVMHERDVGHGQRRRYNSVFQTERCEPATRTGAQRDAGADFTERAGLFAHVHAPSGARKCQRGRQTAQARADDQRR